MRPAWRTLATLVLIASLGLLAASVLPLPSRPVVDVPAVVPLEVTARPTATGSAPTASRAPAPVGEAVRLALPRAGYAADVRPMAIGASGVIDPPDFQHVFRVTDRGVAPGAAATDTTYFACHTNARKSADVVPCNAVTSETVHVGDPLEVTLADGVLTYEVTQARQVPRDEFEHDQEVWDVNPGRLVVVTCYLSEGRRTDYNFVIIAELRR